MIYLDDLFLRAALAGLGVALAATPLGCFVVWRRMAYFGDATAHAAILGVAIALGFELSIFTGVLTVAIGMALAIWVVSDRGVASDTALGVMSHSALAFGLVAVSMLDGVRVDLNAYLFGDILAVSRADLAVIWAGAILIAGLIFARWSVMLTATLSPELARASGVAPRREALVLTLMLAVSVAIAIKVVGALLIGAMLIIPAAAARPLSATPERMAIWAAAIGTCSALVGLKAAFIFDTPAGPTIVCTAAVLFCATNIVATVRR